MSKSKIILVTGANGLLGFNTIIKLLSEDYYVKGFLRNRNKFTGVQDKRLELIEGDLQDIEKLESALEDCYCVIHSAAITDQNILDYNDYYNVNVKGVINVTNAAIKNRVKRIIYVSTANEFGYGNLECLGNETSEMRYPYNKFFYSKSKKVAHDFLKTKLNQIEVVIVNPTFMIGAYDSKPSSGRIVLMGLKNRIIFCPPGGKNFVCVDDVSKGIINAIKKGRNGEAYLLANQNLNFYDFFKLLKEITNGNFLIIKIPKEVLQLMGRIGSMIRMCGIKTDIYTESMTAISINNFYSNEKALMELGIDFKPIEHGIRDAVRWFGKTSN